MQHITSAEIGKMEKLFRLNLINSVTGYKSANLIATKSEQKGVNVAVFSSVTHLGSNPALLGLLNMMKKFLNSSKQAWKKNIWTIFLPPMLSSLI